MNRRTFFKSIVAGIAALFCVPKSYPWTRIGVDAHYDKTQVPGLTVDKARKCFEDCAGNDEIYAVMAPKGIMFGTMHDGRMTVTDASWWKVPDITGPTDTLYIEKET